MDVLAPGPDEVQASEIADEECPHRLAEARSRARAPGWATPGRTSRRSPPTGPLPETSDLVAGWFMIDVESRERAVELASYVSSEPGPAGAAPNRVQLALPVHDAME